MPLNQMSTKLDWGRDISESRTHDFMVAGREKKGTHVNSKGGWCINHARIGGGKLQAVGWEASILEDARFRLDDNVQAELEGLATAVPKGGTGGCITLTWGLKRTVGGAGGEKHKIV